MLLYEILVTPPTCVKAERLCILHMKLRDFNEECNIEQIIVQGFDGPV